MTQAELDAALATVGRPIIQSGISKIENGSRRVDVDDLVALALALGTTPHALLGWDENANPPIDLSPDCATCRGFPPPRMRCADCGTEG